MGLPNLKTMKHENMNVNNVIVNIIIIIINS